uniref:Uncharacterized protein n=1 Tax=Arundo donax TaxID=35708 RepID=A0A0A8ZMJ9_ARUDO
MKNFMLSKHLYSIFFQFFLSFLAVGNGLKLLIAKFF